MRNGHPNRNMETALSHERLRELLDYDPETGEFFWTGNGRKGKGGRRRRVRAGCYNRTTRCPYVLLGIDGNVYLAHRVAWFYMTGVWPKDQIDHKDNNGLNNRWDNLHEATASQNRYNTKPYAKSKLGTKGIYFRPPRPKQQRLPLYEVRVNGDFIGHFATLAEAKAARELAARKAHGEFYRDQ